MDTASRIQRQILKQLKITRRIDINVGFKCNLRCKFCYNLNDIQSGHTHHLTLSEIKRLIDQYKAIIPSINIRDLPFCLMKGYEPHIKTMQQLQYENVEWDYFLDVMYKKPSWFLLGATVLGGALLLNNPRFLHANGSCRYHYALQQARIFLARKKGPMCRNCALRYICDGLPTQYAMNNGTHELAPYAGNVILDPTYFFPEGEAQI